MRSWEVVAGARTIGPGPTSRLWAHCKAHKKWRLLLPTPIPVSRIHIQVSKRIWICRTQSCGVASLSPVLSVTRESEEKDDATDFSAIPSSLLSAEREEAKAVLKLFLRKQGMSNALAARTINKSDSFVDYLISKLHSVHKSRYMIGRELTTLEIRSALISYLESLLEEHGNLLIDMVENFPDPPGTSSDRASPISPSSRIDPTSARDRAMARVIQLDEKGHLSPQVLYLLDLGMDLDSIQKIARQFPSFTYYSLDRKIKPVVDFLLDLGVSKQHIPKILQRRPQLCGISLTENLKPTIIYLESIGVDKTQWAKVIRSFPALLTCSRQKMKSFIDFLIKLGVPECNIGKILTRSPRILSYSVEEKLGPVSEYFASLGIDVASLIQKCPQNFGLSIEANLKPVTEFFYERGFSIEEIGTMVNKYGALYTLSLEGNLVPKWEYFLTMGYPRSELVKFPHYFGYNLERRIKPRFNRVMECGLSFGLNRMLSTANSKFEGMLEKEMKKLARSGKLIKNG